MGTCMNYALFSNIVEGWVKLQYHFPGVSYVGNTVQTHSYEFRVVGNATFRSLTNHYGSHVHSRHVKSHRMR